MNDKKLSYFTEIERNKSQIKKEANLKENVL